MSYTDWSMGFVLGLPRKLDNWPMGFVLGLPRELHRLARLFCSTSSTRVIQRQERRVLYLPRELCRFSCELCYSLPSDIYRLTNELLSRFARQDI